MYLSGPKPACQNPVRDRERFHLQGRIHSDRLSNYSSLSQCMRLCIPLYAQSVLDLSQTYQKRVYKIAEERALKRTVPMLGAKHNPLDIQTSSEKQQALSWVE